MTKREYMDCISSRLRHLPREDYDMARDYFLEYFEEAGEENEQQAIADLGLPEEAADQIIMNIAIGKGAEGKQGVKKSFSAVWVGLLAIFAAPIALPLALGIAIVALALLFAAVAFCLCFILMGICMAVVGVFGIVGGFCLLFASPVNAIATVGMGLVIFGIGVLFSYAVIKFWSIFIHVMVKFFGRLVKGGKKDEVQ